MQEITIIDGKPATRALSDAGLLPVSIGGFDYPGSEAIEARDKMEAWNYYENEGRVYGIEVQEVR